VIDDLLCGRSILLSEIESAVGSSVVFASRTKMPPASNDFGYYTLTQSIVITRPQLALVREPLTMVS